jgi:predicted Zn-dependent protease
MKAVYILSILFLYSNISFSQEQIESNIESAVQNAKKGVYWALSNIPVKKAKIEKSIVSEDRLLAKVKIAKELNGVRVESTGYYQTNEVTIVLYRSRDSLIKDGYIKKGDLESYSEED